MDIRLRNATREDAAAIRALVRGARINPTGLDWRRFVVAVNGQGHLIGCGQIKPHRDGTQELASLVVSPAFQGRGFARVLIQRLLADHPGEVYLMCRSALGGFYKRFGFRPVDVADMPPYFRRVARLARLAEFLMSEGEILLVMRRDDPALNL